MTDAQAVPNTNMVPHKEIEIDDNISVPFEEMYTRHHKFHERIDQLAEVQMCHVCLDSYAGIQVHVQCGCDVYEMDLIIYYQLQTTWIEELNLTSLNISYKLKRCL